MKAFQKSREDRCVMYVTEGVSYNLDEDNDIHDKLLSIELTDKHKGEGGGRGVKGLRALQDF